jgi:hypothetical protein
MVAAMGDKWQTTITAPYGADNYQGVPIQRLDTVPPTDTVPLTMPAYNYTLTAIGGGMVPRKPQAD